jgi:glycosyltransferase involved in cell wall biosynthesis
MRFEGRTALGSRVFSGLAPLKELVRPYYLKWLYFRWKKENYPRSFKKCWEYPTTGIAAFLERSESEQGNRRDLVFLPMADWHLYTQRSQHFATSLASMGYRCFYVNPHLGREFPQTYFNSPSVLVSTLGQRLLELHIHLLLEPVFHCRRLRSNETAIITNAIETVLGTASSARPALIVSFPVWQDVAFQLRERLGCKVIYDCHDLMAGFEDISEDLLEAEQRLFTDCDLIVFSARQLMESILGQHPGLRGKAVLMRNAVDLADFPACVSRDGSNARGAQKVIGYVGALNSWFDTESVRLAALAHPELRFVLVGPVASRKLDVLRSIPNILFLGQVPYREVASHLSKMDVAIIPFLSCPLTLATNPIKLYEYFACGLPVVSTRLPEMDQFPGLVYLADNPDEFLVQIEKALQEDDPALRSRRRDVARQESWMARCAQLVEEIRKLDA